MIRDYLMDTKVALGATAMRSWCRDEIVGDSVWMLYPCHVKEFDGLYVPLGVLMAYDETFAAELADALACQFGFALLVDVVDLETGEVVDSLERSYV